MSDDDNIRPFLFDGQITVRVIDKNGELWFVAADVCRALGLLNAADAVKGIDQDEKGIENFYTLGGHQEMVIINESGLYALVIRSHKPEAKRFRKWITAEVLPSLRRTGKYTMPSHRPGSDNTFHGKPYRDWTLEEKRVALAQVRTARDVLNQGSAAWMWERVGLPMPPRYLLPVWWQTDLPLTTSLSAH